MSDSKKKILIVDDSELNRSLLADMLAGDFDIIEAENGAEAIRVLHEHELEISLMLLDIVMPQMDGFGVLSVMNRKGWIKTIPVIMISAETGGTYIDRAYDLGAIDYISRPFDEAPRQAPRCLQLHAQRAAEGNVRNVVAADLSEGKRQQPDDRDSVAHRRIP